jgi:PAS domain S-box-containing protein
MNASGEELASSSNNLIQAVCNATDAVVFAVDDAGLVVAFNDRAQRLFERPASDVIGKAPSMLFAEGRSALSKVANWGRQPGRYNALIRLGNRAGSAVNASVSRAELGDQHSFIITLDPSISLEPAAPDVQAALFHDVVDSMTDGVAIVRDGQRVYVNPAYVELFGYSSTEEALGDVRHGRWLPEDSAARDADDSRFGPLRPHRIVRAEGGIRLVEGSRSELIFEGEPAAAVVLRDVTHREQILRDASVQEARLWPMFERLPVGVAIVARDRTMMEANPALATMLQSTPEALRGRTFGEPFPTANQTANRDGVWAKILAGEVDFDVTEREVIEDHLDIEWVRVSVFAVRDEAGAYAYSIHTVEDITDRKTAEAGRETSDALWWQTFEQSHIGMALVSADRNIVEANPAFAKMVGGSPAELRGTWFGQPFPPARSIYGDNQWDRLIRGEEASFENEREVIAAGATAEWVSISTSAVRDDSGTFLYAVRTVQDITEAKRAEQELRASEVQFRSLFEEAPFAIAMMDSESGLFAGNASWEVMFGYSVEEMKGYRSTDFLSPLYERRNTGALNRILAGTLEFEDNEWLYRRKDGTDVWASGRVSGVSDGKGGISYVLFMLQDITDRKRAIADLERSQAQFVATVEQAPVGIAIIGGDRNFIQVNPLLAKLIGVEPDRLVGSGFRSLFKPETTGLGADKWLKMLSGEIASYEQERQLASPPPGIEWLSIATSAVRDDSGAFLFAVRAVSDITERKRAEAEIRESEERLRGVFESGPFGVVLLDEDIRVIDTNQWFPAMLGFSRDEVIGRRMEEFVDPAYPRKHTNASQRLVSGEEDRVTTDRRYQRKDGSTFSALVSTSAVRDENGRFKYAVRAIQDITVRERAVQDLRTSEARFRALFEEAPFPIVLIRPEFGVETANQAMQDLIGYTEDEIKGHLMREFLSPDPVPRGIDNMSRLLQGSLNHDEHEWLYRRKDGQDVWTRGKLAAMHREDGQVDFAFLMLEDITERKRAEASIRDSEARFRSIFDDAPQGIALKDKDNLIIEANRALVAFLERPAEELKGHRLRDFVSPSEYHRGEGNYARLVAEGSPVLASERLFIRPDGTEVWGGLSQSSVRDSDGNFVYAVMTVEDVTVRHHQETEIRDREAWFRAVFESGPLGLALIDADTRIVDVNQQLMDMLGFSRDEMIGTVPADYSDPDYQRQGLHESQTLVSGESETVVTDRRYRRKDGSTFPATVSTSAIRDEDGAFRFGIRAVQDVTERARFLSDLSASEARFRAIFEGAPLGIALVAPGIPEIMDANDELLAMFGVDRESVIGRRLRDFWAETPSAEEIAESNQLAEGSQDRSVAVRKYHRADGSTFDALAISAAIRDSGGAYLYGVRIIQDISDQVRAQAELFESEARFRVMFENAPMGTAIVDDVHASITDLNAGLSELFGYSRDEMIGWRLADFRAVPLGTDNRTTSQAMARGEVDRTDAERLYRRKDGSEFEALVSTAAVRDDQGRYLYSIRTVQDITERKEIERGKDEFIAMTSHELRTPVTAMHAAVTLVAQGAFGEMPAKAQNMLNIAASNSDRLVALVNDLIDLERMHLGKVDISVQQINAGEIVLQAADLVRPLADEVGVTIQVDPVDVRFTADPGRMLQTLQNLLGNAIKFSPVSTTVVVRVEDQGDSVRLSVADQGRGIPADQLERIFERFQQVDSSDARGAGGSGLGLAIAKAIVEAHMGRIWVESELGEGSTFFVEMPREMPQT